MRAPRSILRLKFYKMLFAITFIFLLLLVYAISLQLDGQRRHAVLFTQNNLRVHDNVCLKFIETDHNHNYIPVYLNEHNLPVDQKAVKCFTRNLHKIGGELKCVDVELSNAGEFFRKSGVQSVVTSRSHSHYDQMIEGLQSSTIKVTVVNDDLGLKLGKARCFDSSLYRRKHKWSQPQLSYQINFDNNNVIGDVQTTNDTDEDESLAGEDLALKLLSDYLSMGESAFTDKYQDQYAQTIAHSEDHLQSVRRLRSSPNRRSAFFQGEVLSGLLAPLVTMGCISPRLLMAGQRTMVPGVLLPDRWLGDVVREEAIRRDWHTHLASLHPHRSMPIVHSNAANATQAHWKFSFTPWRGYIQRQAVMISDSAPEILSDHRTTNITSAASSDKPILLLLHGFGGSITQYTALAQSLTDQFEVHALDSLGFGQSEKPPISYNQYLWRDQAVEYLQSIAQSRGNGTLCFTVAGNSIGGFTAASVAATVANSTSEQPLKLHCEGLILFNSAGVIVNNTSDGVRYTPENGPTFPEYTGPPSALLRVFGRGLTATLRSQVVPTCRWLYPTNKDYVTSSGLVDDIVRDSFDPGAAGVFAAGGKLPKPLTMNALLEAYKGPVLVAQGALDPLNDAVGRAIALGNIRPNIRVNLLQLGHCPMDEGAAQVAECLKKWAADKGVLNA